MEGSDVATTRYRSTSGERLEASVVDRRGAVHDALVFDPEVSVKDDEGETYDQTLRNLLEAGLIEVAKPTRKAT